MGGFADCGGRSSSEASIVVNGTFYGDRFGCADFVFIAVGLRVASGWFDLFVLEAGLVGAV